MDRLKKSSALAATLAFLPLSFAFSADAPKPRSITVLCEAQASAPPDKGVVSMHFVAYGWTADKSRRKVSKLIEEVKEKIAKQGIRYIHMDVGDAKLKPSYQFNRDLRQSVPSDFLVSRQVLLEFDDLDMIPKLMDASISVGSFMVDSAYLTVKDKEALQMKAFENALEAGKKKGQAAATAAGAQLGGIVSVEEVAGGVGDISLMQDTDFSSNAAGLLKTGGTAETKDQDLRQEEPGAYTIPENDAVKARSALRITFSLK